MYIEEPQVEQTTAIFISRYGQTAAAVSLSHTSLSVTPRMLAHRQNMHLDIAEAAALLPRNSTRDQKATFFLPSLWYKAFLEDN